VANRRIRKGLIGDFAQRTSACQGGVVFESLSLRQTVAENVSARERACTRWASMAAQPRSLKLHRLVIWTRFLHDCITNVMHEDN
jgi:hypothetical protein